MLETKAVSKSEFSHKNQFLGEISGEDHSMSNSKSSLISLMTMKCLSFVTSFNFLFNAVAAITASIAGTGS